MNIIYYVGIISSHGANCFIYYVGIMFYYAIIDKVYLRINRHNASGHDASQRDPPGSPGPVAQQQPAWQFAGGLCGQRDRGHHGGTPGEPGMGTLGWGKDAMI